MISCETLSELFAEGRIPDEFLKFADVKAPNLLGIFPGLDSPGGFPLCFEEQCTQNVLGMMGCGPGGQHLFKGGLYQRILLELPFDGRMRNQVGQRIYRFAPYRNLIGLAFAEVCELKGIVNVLKVQVFFDRLREELALMRELGHCIRLDSFVDHFFVLANQLAKFCEYGIVHFRYPSEGQCYYAVAWCVAKGAALQSLRGATVRWMLPILTRRSPRQRGNPIVRLRWVTGTGCASFFLNPAQPGCWSAR